MDDQSKGQTDSSFNSKKIGLLNLISGDKKEILKGEQLSVDKDGTGQATAVNNQTSPDPDL